MSGVLYKAWLGSKSPKFYNNCGFLLKVKIKAPLETPSPVGYREKCYIRTECPQNPNKQGGHFNRSTQEYHCHKEPCFSLKSGTQKATQEAKEEKRDWIAIYDREDWKHWSDSDGDCQDTRVEVLIMQSSTNPSYYENGCKVSKGTWKGSYGGKTFYRSRSLDVDHVIPLFWAHTHGGAAWSPEKKERFANDFDNLIAVEAKLNRQKGGKGPDKWLPPNRQYQCDYIYHWEYLLKKYPSLTMNSRESFLFNHSIERCQAGNAPK